MAAGRDNVSKRRVSYKSSSIQEFDQYRNDSFGVGVHGPSKHYVTYKSGHRSSSKFEDSGPEGVGFYGKREEREKGEFCRHNREYEPASGFKEGDAEIEDREKALAPPAKRRKFSPIAWDLAEKEVRVSSKNRITEVSAMSPISPSLPNAQEANGSDVVNPESPSDSSDVLPQEHSVNEIKDVHQSEENHVQGWNIGMSRWAYHGYSPSVVSDDEEMHVNGSSSLESGEFRGESLEGKRGRSSGSGGGGHYSGPSSEEGTDSEKEFLLVPDTMEDEEEHSETTHVSHPTSDSEDSGSSMHVQRNINMLHSCRSVFEFEMINKISEGTYGVVYKARDKKTGEIVALKKVKMNIDREGFPLSSLREINILLSFNHPSIVNVKEVVVDDFDGVFMVMEYMEYELRGLMELMKQPFSISEIKSFMRKLLEGVKYLHDNWILHRDLKTSNILLNKEGELKICDFGLSRQYGSPLKPYTPVVVTLWYRAPELLLGAKEYSTAIDMWSLGCIMAELVAKVPLFKGKSEVEQLNKIFQTLGTPNEKVWPGLSKLPGSKASFVKQPYNLLRKKFPVASFTGSPVLSELGFDLLSKLLTYDPEKRITAETALLHDWFRESPLPKSDFNSTFPSQRG